MKKIRYYVYIPTGLIFLYLTFMVITNNDDEYNFGYINFSKDEVNNYSSLLGAIVGLFGVILLVETLWLQYKQFEATEKEKEKKDKIDSYYKLSLLNTDLSVIINDIESKSERIKEYFENTLSSPFNTHMLFRTPSRNYSRILDLDRLSIYKGFEYFFDNDKLWLKSFNRLYSILDYLPDYLKDIYDKYDSHSEEVFKRKDAVREALIKLMDRATSYINQNFKNSSSLVETMVYDYYTVLKESYDQEGNVISETDFIKIDENVLKKFIETILKNQKDYDSEIELLLALSSNIRKQIHLIKDRNLEFANNIKDQYENLNVNKEDKESILSILKSLKEEIEQVLNRIDLSKI